MEALLNITTRLMVRLIIFVFAKLGKGVGLLIRMGIDKANDRANEREYVARKKTDQNDVPPNLS